MSEQGGGLGLSGVPSAHTSLLVNIGIPFRSSIFEIGLDSFMLSKYSINLNQCSIMILENKIFD